MMRVTDPPVRADGKCARVGCARDRKLTKEARRYAGDQIEFDPFCSTECCRKHHGIVWAKDDKETTAKRSAAGRKGNEIRKSLAGIA